MSTAAALVTRRWDTFSRWHATAWRIELDARAALAEELVALWSDPSPARAHLRLVLDRLDRLHAVREARRLMGPDPETLLAKELST